jgi:hypothetical protein
MSRRFQFSLRALLVALTTACLWLGWEADRARRRGQAIDAVVEMGCLVGYLDSSESEVVLALSRDNRTDHFWLDLKSSPVVINLQTEDAWSHNSVKAAIACQLSRIARINEVCLPEVHIDCMSGSTIGVDGRERRSNVELVLPNSTIVEPTVYHCGVPKRNRLSGPATQE